MFYSHEILTSKKGGVATVWLVATLGSKSNSRRVNRKAILDVNVPKTCQIIIEPEAPMALRLQGNLLYGVSRVFSQQCGYILSDAQIFQTHMRALINAVKTSDLDPNAGKAHPDQLIIHDDPAFLPDFMDLSLSALESSIDASSRRSSILSPHSQRSSQSSNLDADESMLGLIIPSSNSGGAGDLGGFVLPEDDYGSAQPSARLGRLLDDEDEGFNNDPGFFIDGEGNVIEGAPPAGTITPAQRERFGSDSGISGRVRQELLRGLQAGEAQPDAMDLDLDLNLPTFDDHIILPDAEAFPQMALQPEGSGERRASEEQNETSQSAEAPSRRKSRAPKPLPVDERQELHNTDLAQWKNDYAANMLAAKEAKKAHQAPSIAKKNAAFWVFGAGIGNVGAGTGTSNFRSPLGIFAGGAMLESLTGIRTPVAGRKRGRSDEEDDTSDSEARRLRLRDDEGELGRGDQLLLNDDDPMMMSVGDGIEIGRHAPAPLEDPSFPWNVSSALGSRQGSIARSRGFASSVGGFPTSAGVPSSLPGHGGVGPGSLDRRGSRIPSASPLVGRGRGRYSSLELPMHNDNGILPGSRGDSGNHDVNDFQLYGPAAGVNTQTAATSQWMKATLDNETNNFLEYVKAEIAAIPASADEQDELSAEAHLRDSVLFENLLPPTQHSKIVAAQALHHILALVSTNLLRVRQDVSYGPIDLSLSSGV